MTRAEEIARKVMADAITDNGTPVVDIVAAALESYAREAPEPEREWCVKSLRRLPRYPYHTWNDQELIGLNDTVKILAAHIRKGQ